jgi:hypothetical protein
MATEQTHPFGGLWTDDEVRNITYALLRGNGGEMEEDKLFEDMEVVLAELHGVRMAEALYRLVVAGRALVKVEDGNVVYEVSEEERERQGWLVGPQS